jgi:hypothetical protein
MPKTPFIDCSVCNKKTVAFRGSCAFKSRMCMECYNKEYMVAWVSKEGHISMMSKESYNKNQTK